MDPGVDFVGMCLSSLVLKEDEILTSEWVCSGLKKYGIFWGAMLVMEVLESKSGVFVCSSGLVARNCISCCVLASMVKLG